MKENIENDINGYDDWEFMSEDELKKAAKESLKANEGFKYSSNPIIEEYYRSIEEENKQSYRDYIDRHHRKADHTKDGFSDYKENVSKALAAQVLLDSPVTYEYSPRLITFVAQRMEKALDLKNVSTDRMIEAMEDHEAAKSLMNDQIINIYKVKDPDTYIKKMKTLYENLMPKQGRSEDYKDFYNSVGKIANLKKDDPHLQAKLYMYSFDLMRNTEGYAKGKKSVRLRKDGRDRFDNSMDALAIMKECVPGAKGMIGDIVYRTNEVRKTMPGDEYYVDLDKFGAERAKSASEARKERELAKAKTKDNKLEKKMDNKYKAPGLM